MLEQILESFGLNNHEIATYNLLLKEGGKTAGQIARKLGKPRSSVYGFLADLMKKGLVVESQKEKIKVFSPEPPQRINQLFEQHLESIKNAQKEFRQLLPELSQNKKSLSLSPKFQIYQGKEELQQILKDMLLYYDLNTEAFWPISDMLEVLTPEFFRYLNKIRIKNNLYTKAIWPEDKAINPKEHPYLGIGKEFKREIRIAPSGLGFSMGYWAYGNRVAFISSAKESFGMIIESEELAQMLHAQFEIIWKISTPLKVDPKDTKCFIDELKKYST